MHENSSAASIPKVLSRIRALADRQARDAEGCFWIEGIRNFVQACDAKLTFQTVLHSPVLLKSSLAEMLVRRLIAAGIPRVRVAPEQFRSVSTAASASGIGAIVRQHWTALESARPSRGLCWLILESLRSPGNLGTILRTAEACGAGGVIFLGDRCDPFDPAVVRASMSGIFHLQLIRTTHECLRGWARAHGIQLVGLAPNATRLWTELPAAARTGLIIGGERAGLSPRLLELCNEAVRLPMSGRADSLNVAVAAGVMMYEMVRRDQKRDRSNYEIGPVPFSA